MLLHGLESREAMDAMGVAAPYRESGSTRMRPDLVTNGELEERDWMEQSALEELSHWMERSALEESPTQQHRLC